MWQAENIASKIKNTVGVVDRRCFCLFRVYLACVCYFTLILLSSAKRSLTKVCVTVSCDLSRAKY